MTVCQRAARWGVMGSAFGAAGQRCLAGSIALLVGTPGEQDAARDRIVQAAMLCGPYLHPNALNRSVSLPADFSAIAPLE